MFEEINGLSHVSIPSTCAWSPPNHRLSLSDIKRHKYIKSKFYKQTHCMRAVIDTKGRQTNTLHDRIDTNWNSINKPVISCSLILRRPSLSIRRFWGKGERWKRKREGLILRLVRAQLFERRLNFNPGFFIFLSKALSQIIFSFLFRVSNYQIVAKEN